LQPAGLRLFRSAKSASGKVAVEEALKLAHEVQSPSSYTSIIATQNC
jgi:acetylornithine/succinyldiaminopimelate/putrescine aminotransferase